MTASRLRGLAAATAVAAAGALATWSGHIGAGTWWRGVAAVLVAVVAFFLLGLAGAVALEAETDDAGGASVVPSIGLVVVTVWLTATADEARAGEWRPAVVAERTCSRPKEECEPQYRVTDLSTETDLGWMACGKTWYHPGEQTRVRVDPAGRHSPNLEPCAHTSRGWTIALRVVQGVWVAVILGTAVAGLLRRDEENER
ncbi:hypothetical protein [Dactylosporangium matsuzakiense]|uniref:Uncharacterized protein n=1 Tax=Dactylosporangium matsuzakiense TaxID=53360 RepID=A0A9W6KFC1_9ACTN|nr:hypothetical protein [Dactylosporangium matsuzakiense]UWZ42199.1 hypothetical protein Dmats_32065 [Dactylosporangium matsuzakiense]GLK99841.1 hypothetical protein GCM10017581_015820 [Dactylosporangium matsuzakiense]